MHRSQIPDRIEQLIEKIGLSQDDLPPLLVADLKVMPDDSLYVFEGELVGWDKWRIQLEHLECLADRLQES